MMTQRDKRGNDVSEQRTLSLSREILSIDLFDIYRSYSILFELLGHADVTITSDWMISRATGFFSFYDLADRTPSRFAIYKTFRGTRDPNPNSDVRRGSYDRANRLRHSMIQREIFPFLADIPTDSIFGRSCDHGRTRARLVDNRIARPT